MELLQVLTSNCLTLVVILFVTAGLVFLVRSVSRMIPGRAKNFLLAMVLIGSLVSYYCAIIFGSMQPPNVASSIGVPFLLVVLGLVIRAMISHWVRDRRLREVASEYWLGITAYLVVSFVIAEISNWNWLVLLSLALFAVFAVAVGVFEIGTDMASWVGRAFRILLQFITVYATRFGRFLYRMSRGLYQWYVIHIKTPVERTLKRIEDYVTYLLISMGLTPTPKSGSNKKNSFFNRFGKKRRP